MFFGFQFGCIITFDYKKLEVSRSDWESGNMHIEKHVLFLLCSFWDACMLPNLTLHPALQVLAHIDLFM
jgi:hypothetical protein